MGIPYRSRTSRRRENIKSLEYHTDFDKPSRFDHGTLPAQSGSDNDVTWWPL